MAPSSQLQLDSAKTSLRSRPCKERPRLGHPLLPGSWKEREKAAIELDMVVNVKQVLVPCLRAEVARRLHGERVELLRILTPAAVKTLTERRHARQTLRATRGRGH